jgi:HSP20 family protein
MTEKIFFTNLDELKNGLDTKKGEITFSDFDTPEQAPDWFSENYEGQLAVDVYQTDDEIVVKSTIAGVQPEDLEIFLNDDLLTIRGKREQSKEEKSSNYFYKECYWGGFSRSIILPTEVNPKSIDADLSNGILTIRMPKIEREKTVTIKVKKK